MSNLKCLMIFTLVMFFLMLTLVVTLDIPIDMAVLFGFSGILLYAAKLLENEL